VVGDNHPFFHGARADLMKYLGWSGIILAFACLAVLGAPAPPEKDYQKIADKEEWKWEKEQASVFYSQKQYKGAYELELQPGREGGIERSISFKDGDSDYTIIGHDGTVFVERKNVVYYADFSQWSSGCSVVAYDLKAKKRLWKADLKGLGPINHTRYHNAVILELKDDALHILGNESAGKYVEYLELKSGKMVGHRIFKEE
jgi:hypothetical protein